jgi:diguanylate cyclase (GGDEF)-like protein/PAS domain S-box-containing protein
MAYYRLQICQAQTTLAGKPQHARRLARYRGWGIEGDPVPADERHEVLLICEVRPAGELTLRAIQAALGKSVRCHPVWSREELELALDRPQMFSAVLLGNELGWSQGLTVLKELPHRISAPVIMITDTNGADLVAEGFRLGLSDFLRPTQFDRLPAILDAHSPPNPDISLDHANDESPAVNQQRSRAISTILSDYVFSFYIHSDGRIENEWRSDGLRRISGYTVEQFAEIGWERVVHPEDHDAIWERTRLVMAGESPVTEYRVITADGETRWVRETTRPIWNSEEGRYNRFVGSAQDITQERLSELVRVGQMRTLELIATGAPMGQVLDEVMALIESQESHTSCAVHRVDGEDNGLQLLQSSTQGDAFRDALARQADDPERSCQAAASRNHQVIVVPDFATEDRWTDHRQLVLEAGYRSAIVVPIVGSHHNVLGTLTVYRNLTGEPCTSFLERVMSAARLIGVAIEKSSSEQALLETRVQNRALFENNPHFAFSLDNRGRFQRINNSVRERAGYADSDLLGRSFTSVLVAGKLERAWYHFRQTLQGLSQQFETEIFTKRGVRVPLSVTCIPYMVNGEVAGVSGVAEDISEREYLHQQLEHQAFHDGLTGIPNRTLFNERLSQAIAVQKRTASSVAVLFVDLDNFKTINDSLGHESGDEYLKIMATWLRNCVGSADTVARFGGDEFTVLLVYPRDDQGYPVKIAEQIGERLNQPVVINGHEINTGVSIGMSINSSANVEMHELLRQADIALYQAKRAGQRTLYRIFEADMQHQIVHRMEIERDLRRAIRRNEFVVHYQPIIELNTEEIVHVEALVRWQHPQHGLLPPGRFLPIAEETGQIVDIDRFVMGAACRQISEWNRSISDIPPLVLAVNLSNRELRYSELVDWIPGTLEETGCAPSWLKLELTESSMMQDISSALEVLQQLRKLGIGFSIDDFGTGYSSLSYLQRLPLDTLKIDRSFIDGLGGDEDDELMVRTIISLASALNLEVIAEGIETEVQLQRARELGCHRGQGFLIERPVPFEQLTLRLRRGDERSHRAGLG